MEAKGHNDFVTSIDKLSEQRIVNALKEVVPEAGFIVEENSARNRSDKYNWIVDPIDGTTNFIHGVVPYAVSIALAYKDEIVLGVVYEAGLDECFYAWKDGGAWLTVKPSEYRRFHLLKTVLSQQVFRIATTNIWVVLWNR